MALFAGFVTFFLRNKLLFYILQEAHGFGFNCRNIHTSIHVNLIPISIFKYIIHIFHQSTDSSCSHNGNQLLYTDKLFTKRERQIAQCSPILSQIKKTQTAC